jgi:hypothetical protein
MNAYNLGWPNAVFVAAIGEDEKLRRLDGNSYAGDLSKRTSRGGSLMTNQEQQV